MARQGKPRKYPHTTLDRLLQPTRVTPEMHDRFERYRRALSRRRGTLATQGDVVRAALDQIAVRGGADLIDVETTRKQGTLSERISSVWVRRDQKDMIEDFSVMLMVNKSEVVRRILEAHLDHEEGGGDQKSIPT